MKSLVKLFYPTTWLAIFGYLTEWAVFGCSKLFGGIGHIAAVVLMRVPGMKKVPYLKMIFDDQFDIADYYRQKDIKDKKASPLRRDDLETAAEDYFPKEKHAWLYKEGVRVDMNPSPIIDSKLPNFKDTSWMSYRFATDKVVNSSFRDGAFEALEDGASVFFLATFAIMFFAMFSWNIEISPLSVFGGPGADDFFKWDPQVNFALTVSHDTWTTGVPLMTEASAWIGVISAALSQALFNPFVYILSLSFMFISYFSIGYDNLYGRIKQAGKAYLVTTKQEQITNRYNSVDREENKQALIKAVEYNENVLTKKGFDGGILLGHSTGQLVARGADPYIHMPKGTPTILDYESLYGHIGIMGNTGSGKTSLVLKRTLSEIASIDQMGMMLIDYKAVLPFELLEQFKKDIADKLYTKLRIIGTGAVDGTPDYGVNLMTGIRPDILKGLIQSVMEQTEKESGSDYFDKAAYQLLEHAARLLQAWQFTEEGFDWSTRNGRDVYNMMLMVDIVEKDLFRMSICRDIVNALGASTVSKSKSGNALKTLDRKSLRASLRYMGGAGETTWNGMSERQKSGVIGTFQNIVSHLNSNPVLRERFFEGRNTSKDKMVTISEAVEKGYIMPVNISSEEDGMAGMFAITLMKTQVFAETSRRQKMLAKEGKNPQIESPFCLMIDEAQNFITAGNISMSDAKVLNTARSTGLSVIYGFQNINSIEKRIGKENTKDVLANLTTKITLVNGENDTAEYFSKHFGETQRLRTHFEGQYENFWQAANELDLLTPEEFEEKLENNPRFKAAIYRAYSRPKSLYSLLNKSIKKLPDYETDIDIDEYTAMIPTGGGIRNMMSGGQGSDGSAGKGQIASMLLQFKQRQEDKREHALMNGNEYRPLIPVSDVSELPQGHAIIEWRTANHMRKDIVKLLPGIY